MSNLYDTSIFVDYLRGNAHASDYLQTRDLRCSAITAAELLQSTRNKREQKVVEQLLNRIVVLPVVPTIGVRMLDLIRQFYHSHGLAIPDGLIAATAVEHGLTLVTHNVKHFSFIPSLSVAPWGELMEKATG